jgi:1-acyl-sn-glycerol-3-phosphate acyltransferase
MPSVQDGVGASPSAGVEPPLAYQRLRWALSLLLRVFFRRVEVVGLENLPADRGGILVAAHPNGLVDPTLILAAFTHPVVFGARSGLFRIPVLGAIVRGLGTVPIYRRGGSGSPGEMGEAPAAPEEERRRQNEQSLDALAGRIAAGSFSSLFPEGLSHDAPTLMEFKTGAARLYYRARAMVRRGRPAPVVIPVGLHYDHKRVFRSKALVVFHPPIRFPAELDVSPADPDSDQTRELARKLTERMAEELKSVVLETESWETHDLLHRARKLIRAERASRAGRDPGGASMDERVVGLARVWVAWRERARTDPEQVAALRKRLTRYDRDLRSLGIEDHELDQPPPLRAGFWLLLASQVVSVFLVLPPFLVVGYVVNLPTAFLVSLIARRIGKEDKDMASLKLLAGAPLFPLTWALWAWLAAWSVGSPVVQAWLPWLPESPPLAAAVALTLCIVGAVVMVVYLSLARATWRALRVRLTRGMRARSFLRLRVERARLCDALLALAQGLELPGVVRPDGTVARAPLAPSLPS